MRRSATWCASCTVAVSDSARARRVHADGLVARAGEAPGRDAAGPRRGHRAQQAVVPAVPGERWRHNWRRAPGSCSTR